MNVAVGRLRPASLLLVTLVAVPLVAAPATGPASATPPNPSAAVERWPGTAPDDLTALRAVSAAPVDIATHDETGFVTLVGASAGATLGRPSGVGPDDAPAVAAEAFLQTHRAAFGIEHTEHDLVATSTETVAATGHAVRFQQLRAGVPVLGGELVVRTDESNQILSAAGEILPVTDLDTTADLAAAEAADLATRAVAEGARVPVASLQATAPVLSVFDPAVFGGPALPGSRLVWQLEVAASDDPRLREFVLVDADRGAIVVQFSLVHEAKDRVVCDNAGTLRTFTWPPEDCGTDLAVARGEGDVASGDTEVDAAYEFSGGFHDLLMAHFGRDSVDGAGLPLTSTVDWCYDGWCPFGNAFWSGTQAYYGNGFVVDDVVAHELAHGLTQHTAGLFYYYQSGAINESFSDLYGELFDLATGGDDDVANRWLIGEELAGGAFRDMRDPTAFGDPDRVQSPDYHTGPSDSGGVHSNSGVNNKAVSLLVDGGTFNGRSIAPLGADRTLQLYYEAQTSLLTSAADYATLADALEQACSNLVGTHGITVDDCGEVSQVVAATEMRLEPSGPTTLDAPACPSGTTFGDVLYEEDVEAPGSAWASSTTGGGWSWFEVTGYATSGSQSFWNPTSSSPGTASLAMATDVTLPVGAYLRFAHAHHFEGYDDDGGVVEYSTDAGATWRDLGDLLDANGYTGTIDGWDNPLDHRDGYIGSSGGYTTARATLDGLAGQSVRFRWHVGTDWYTRGLGWLLDDVTVHTCTDLETPTFAGEAALTTAGTTGTSTTLTWSPARDNVRVAGYRVHRDGALVATVDGSATTLEVSGLVPATLHGLSVTAVDAAGLASAPLTTSVVTLDTLAPSFPSSAALVPSEVTVDAFSVTWPAASDNVAVDRYTVTTSTGGAVVGSTTVAATKVSHRFTDLQDSTEHAVVVRAVDEAGNSSVKLSTVVTTSSPPDEPGAEPPVAVEVARVAGSDRYATAAQVSADAFPDGAATVYVATAANFPDALAAGAGAGLGGAPVLLVSNDGIPDATAAELARLSPDRIVVLGGTSVVSAAIQQALGSYAAEVSRLAGADRYATAVQVSRATFAPDVPVVYVATGRTFPDALAGAAAAGRDGGPVLLVEPDAVPPVVATELARLRPDRIVVLGGESAVSSSVASDLATFTDGAVHRVEGADRYDTAARVAATFAAGVDVLYVATGENFPDALTGTPAAVVLGGPIVLVPPSGIPATLAAELDRIRPRRIVVLGGSTVVEESVRTSLEAFLATD